MSVATTSRHIDAADGVELIGIQVTPHQFSPNMAWRQAPEPELSARVVLFVHNPSDEVRTVDQPLRFDGQDPAALVANGAWSWQDPESTGAFVLPPHGLRVVRWNGRSAAWGVGTRHTCSNGEVAAELPNGFALDFEIAEPKLWIQSLAFVRAANSPYPNRMLATVRNAADSEYRVHACRVWLPESNDTYGVLYPGPERTMVRPFPESGVVEPGEILGIDLEFDTLPLTYSAVEIQMRSVRDGTLETLWSHMKIRPASFDISGGWIADIYKDKLSLLQEPYQKTLARMHINAGQIEEVGGFTDNAEVYAKLPIKRFNRLSDRSRYDNDSMIPTIHAVEFLGEPQYGGGRPVPPQEVFDALAPYNTWKIPTSVTLSEERTWRYYAGLSDYPHYDAYRVIAPAADAWSRYDRWNGKSIRWGSPLETIGDMTRSLREQSRPVSIGYWSQGAHHDWGGFLSPRRGSPTPDELRSQAWHGLGNGIASLYWFNLSVRSLAKFPDLIDPIARVGREIQMLRPELELGTSYTYDRTIAEDGQLQWDRTSIATADSLLMVAHDLSYQIDDKTRTFRFEPRDGEFAFRLPTWLRDHVECFRIDADGVHDVEHVRRGNDLLVRDRVRVVGVYLATRDPQRRMQLKELHQQLIKADLELGFDPINNPEDLRSLQALVD